MGLLILGLVIFLGIHLVPALPRKRHKIVRVLGEKNYKIFYSIVAFVGLVMIIWGYSFRYENPVVLFDLPLGLRHITMVFVLVAFVLFVSARLKGHIRYWTRHPQVLAVKLWAFGHLLVKAGDLAGLLLFGSFLAWGIFARISLKKREQFGLVKTRDFQPNWLHDVIAIGIAVVVYVAFTFYLHKVLFGVPLIQ